ncbi:hypothetical protein FA13DRAFT_235293 [Coprinellus micaceus]|uniref:Uncharacterized protein n=1 Tax=Coprinellus micaceus TaxID=71717 RepID=A0A4Y7SFL0_COPMI|nr:hypothetical protein FA13DRAFT_235293 [Coprinellus micaceus]
MLGHAKFPHLFFSRFPFPRSYTPIRIDVPSWDGWLWSMAGLSWQPLLSIDAIILAKPPHSRRSASDAPLIPSDWAPRTLALVCSCTFGLEEMTSAHLGNSSSYSGALHPLATTPVLPVPHTPRRSSTPGLLFRVVHRQSVPG